MPKKHWTNNIGWVLIEFMHNQIYLKTKEVFNSVRFLAISCDEVTMVDGWLQGKLVHFLCHNLVFCRVTCIYMLLTWHKNNNFSNMWLDLNYQLELKDINKKNCNIQTPNI